MSLFDTADGVLMSRAYGWAFLKPVRKVFYNLAVTLLSVTVALVIGILVLTGLVVERLGLESGPLVWIASLDLGHVGFGIVGLFVLTWALALAVWRFGRIEERWAPGSLVPSPTNPSANAGGSNGARSSGPSPRPISFTGMPSSRCTETTMPPFAVPSSLVRTMPVTLTASVNTRAWTMPFCPVVASRTSSTSVTGACFSTTRLILPSSSIRPDFVCSRPAVSISGGVTSASTPVRTASNATDAGSPPSGPGR